LGYRAQAHALTAILLHKTQSIAPGCRGGVQKMKNEEKKTESADHESRSRVRDPFLVRCIDGGRHRSPIRLHVLQQLPPPHRATDKHDAPRDNGQWDCVT
jgi:hypothetical protein